MTTEETYVTAAFLVLLAVVLLYVIIYAFKMRRLEREVRELEGQTEPEACTAAGSSSEPEPTPAEPACEAAGESGQPPEPAR